MNENCESCNYCNYCNSCNHCNSCNYCESCNACNHCNSCNYCDSCNGCYDCENLVNGFRCSIVKLSKKDENRFWIFNKEVTEEEWVNRFELGYEEKEKPKICDKCGQEIKEYSEEKE